MKERTEQTRKLYADGHSVRVSELTGCCVPKTHD